jgi:hypothetical protein
MDLSKLSESDLKAIADGEMSRVSDDGLKALASSPPGAPRAGAVERGALKLKEAVDAAQGLPYVGGSVRALRDFGQAGAQVIGGAVASPEDMRDYRAMSRDSEAAYQQSRAAKGDEGVDWDRLVAKGALDAVAASRLPGVKGGSAPTMLGRMGQGIKIGGFSGLMTPVEGNAEGAPFWATKLAQTVGGAAIGAAAPLVFEPVIAGLTTAVNKAWSGLSGFAKSTFTGSLKDPAIVNSLQVTLKSQNIDWNKLTADVQQSLVKDVRDALKAGKPVTPEQIARYADFKALGTKATRGQTTLDPMLFKQEQNLKGIANVGEELTQRFADQNRAVFDRLGQMRSGVSSQNANPLDAGRAFIDKAKPVLKEQKSVVDDAYDAARAAAGVDADVPMTRIAQVAGKMRDELDLSKLPGPVREQLEAFGLLSGKQTKTFTIGGADRLIQTINRNYNAADPVQSRALDEIRRAINASIDDIANSNTPAAPLFARARQLASQRFTNLEATPALQAVKDGKATADDIIERYVVGKAAKVDDLESLLKNVPSARDDIKAAVLERLRDKAQGLSPDSAPQFQYAAFAREVKRIGEDKLKLVFSGDELAEINRLVRVGSVMNFNPQSVTINRSGTSQAIFDMMGRVQQVPWLNTVVAGPVNRAIQSGQAYNAANSGLAGVPGGMALSEALRARLAERGGLLGAAALAPLPSNVIE